MSWMEHSARMQGTSQTRPVAPWVRAASPALYWFAKAPFLQCVAQHSEPYSGIFSVDIGSSCSGCCKSFVLSFHSRSRMKCLLCLFAVLLRPVSTLSQIPPIHWLMLASFWASSTVGRDTWFSVRMSPGCLEIVLFCACIRDRERIDTICFFVPVVATSFSRLCCAEVALLKGCHGYFGWKRLTTVVCTGSRSEGTLDECAFTDWETPPRGFPKTPLPNYRHHTCYLREECRDSEWMNGSEFPSVALASKVGSRRKGFQKSSVSRFKPRKSGSPKNALRESAAWAA